jgi:hypothetical protein
MSFTFQDSSTAQGDRLVILPEGGSSVSSLSEVRLLASGIPSIIITNEQAIPALTAREHIQNHVMLEAMANGYYLIQQEYGLDPASTITWTATYSEAGWTGSITGRLYNQSLTLNYTGTTVYDVGQNASNMFSASGSFGTNGITINGTAVLGYSSATGGYTNMVFQDQGDVETPLLKWWVAPAEVIVGGAVGGSLADGSGILAGASLAVNISKEVSSISVNGPDPTNPGTPTTAAPPANMTDALSFVPATNQIVTHVFGSGAEYANVGNQIVLNGNWANGQASGVGSVASLVYHGVTLTALGNATLAVSGSELVISNLGSSGQDGVSFALPTNLTALEVEWQPLDMSNTLPIGAYIKEQMIGTANGITNGVLQTLTVTKNGTSNYVMTADSSPIGASNYTVQAYLHGVLVGQATNLPGGQLLTVGGAPYSYDETYLYLSVDYFGHPISVPLGGSPVLCDQLYIIPENVSLSNAPTAFQITASQVPAITITSQNESLVYQGLINTSLGNAALAVSGSELVVSNLGSSGQDGVSIALAPTVGTYCQALWQPLDPTNGLLIGAYVQSQLFGTAGSVTNGLLGWWRLTKLGTTNYAVTADYSPMGSSTVTVQVYNGTNLVATRTGQSGTLGTVAGCVADDEDGNPVPKGPYGIPTGPFGGGLTMFGPLDMQLSDAATVTGDGFVILPEGGVTVTSLSGVQLLASGISQIVITNEQAFASLGQLHNDTLAYYFAHNPIPPDVHRLTLEQFVSMINVNSNFLASTGIASDQIGQAVTLFMHRFTALGMFYTNGSTVYLGGPVVHDQWVPYVMDYLSQQSGPITPLLAEKVDTVNSMTSAGASPSAIFNYITNDIINDGPWSPSELQVTTAFVDIYTRSYTYWTGTNSPEGLVVDHTALWDCVGGLLLWETGPGALVGAAIMSEVAGGGQSMVASNPVRFGGFTNLPSSGSLLDIQMQMLVSEAFTNGDAFGFLIPLNAGEGLDVHWQSLDPSDALPMGAYVQEQIIGTAGPVTNGVLGAVTMTKAGTSNYVVSADFSLIGASTYTVQAYLNGVLVAQAAGQPGASLASCNFWGDSGCTPETRGLGPQTRGLGGGWDWTNGTQIERFLPPKRSSAD